MSSKQLPRPLQCSPSFATVGSLRTSRLTHSLLASAAHTMYALATPAKLPAGINRALVVKDGYHYHDVREECTAECLDVWLPHSLRPPPLVALHLLDGKSRRVDSLADLPLLPEAEAKVDVGCTPPSHWTAWKAGLLACHRYQLSSAVLTDIHDKQRANWKEERTRLYRGGPWPSKGRATIQAELKLAEGDAPNTVLTLLTQPVLIMFHTGRKVRVHESPPVKATQNVKKRRGSNKPCTQPAAKRTRTAQGCGAPVLTVLHQPTFMPPTPTVHSIPVAQHDMSLTSPYPSAQQQRAQPASSAPVSSSSETAVEPDKLSQLAPYLRDEDLPGSDTEGWRIDIARGSTQLPVSSQRANLFTAPAGVSVEGVMHGTAGMLYLGLSF